MDTTEIYKKIVSGYSALEVKGATMPYTSVNGNMFSFISKDGQLNMRLSEKVREEFIKKHKTSLSLQHGVVMKEYVIVPDKLLKDSMIMKKYFELSYNYALSLKAKATTKK